MSGSSIAFRHTRSQRSNSGLQPTWTAALLPSKLCHHRVAVHAAEPVAVRRQIDRMHASTCWAARGIATRADVPLAAYSGRRVRAFRLPPTLAVLQELAVRVLGHDQVPSRGGSLIGPRRRGW